MCAGWKGFGKGPGFWPPLPPLSGAERIAVERQGHMDREGYCDLHDDQHVYGELALAAACYAMPAERREIVVGGTSDGIPIDWPYDNEFWNPTPDNRIRELEKAGALIAAEIDRLQRLNNKA